MKLTSNSSMTIPQLHTTSQTITSPPRSREPGGASPSDVHHEGEGQLREAGVREAGGAQAVRPEGRRRAHADT